MTEKCFNCKKSKAESDSEYLRPGVKHQKYVIEDNKKCSECS
jgi:hypothetical protein